MNAVLIYCDEAAHWASPALRRGFRHVWALIADERARSWIEHDLTTAFGRTARAFAGLDYDVVGHFEAAGCVVQRATAEPWKRHRLPMSTPSCVTMCKELLGINAPWIWTPHQLYRHVERTSSDDHQQDPESAVLAWPGRGRHAGTSATAGGTASTGYAD